MINANAQLKKKKMANRTHRMATKRHNPANRLTLIVLGVFIVLAIVTGIVVFNVARDLFKSWTSTPLDGVPVGGSAGVNASGTPIPLDTVLQPVGGPKPEPWDGKNRITVLVMGLDYRDWEAGDVPRTDTMLLFTLDPVSGSAGMLSIPRDMWVNIPGYDYHKINQAYYFGELDRLPGGGPALAMETVKQFLGIDINYYAQIDFEAFVHFIDEIKGVKITVEEPMTVVVLGTNKKVNLEPGEVTLPGDIALAYARNRYTDGGDFDRARRTQQVVLGIRDRILTFDMLPTLVTRAPVLYRDLAAGIRTNLTLEQVIRLAWLAQQIPSQNIRSAVIGTDQVEFGTSPDGLDILKPIPDKIRLTRDEIFTSGGPVGPVAVTGNARELMDSEAARVSVQNGSSTAGLAGRTSEWLRNEGIDVVDESNADQLYSTTTIFIYNGKPYTVRYLSQIMGIDNPRIYNRYDPNASYDLAIILGSDWANDNPLP